MVLWFHRNPSWRPKVLPAAKRSRATCLPAASGRLKEGMELAVKEWRARFSVENREARVVGAVAGSKASQLAGGRRAGSHDDVRQAYRECCGRWGD